MSPTPRRLPWAPLCAMGRGAAWPACPPVLCHLLGRPFLLKPSFVCRGWPGSARLSPGTGGGCPDIPAPQGTPLRPRRASCMELGPPGGAGKAAATSPENPRHLGAGLGSCGCPAGGWLGGQIDLLPPLGTPSTFPSRPPMWPEHQFSRCPLPCFHPLWCLVPKHVFAST